MKNNGSTHKRTTTQDFSSSLMLKKNTYKNSKTGSGTVGVGIPLSASYVKFNEKSVSKPVDMPYNFNKDFNSKIISKKKEKTDENKCKGISLKNEKSDVIKQNEGKDQKMSVVYDSKGSRSGNGSSNQSKNSKEIKDRSLSFDNFVSGEKDSNTQNLVKVSPKIIQINQNINVNVNINGHSHPHASAKNPGNIILRQSRDKTHEIKEIKSKIIRQFIDIPSNSSSNGSNDNSQQDNKNSLNNPENTKQIRSYNINHDSLKYVDFTTNKENTATNPFDSSLSIPNRQQEQEPSHNVINKTPMKFGARSEVANIAQDLHNKTLANSGSNLNKTLIKNLLLSDAKYFKENVISSAEFKGINTLKTSSEKPMNFIKLPIQTRNKLTLDNKKIEKNTNNKSLAKRDFDLESQISNRSEVLETQNNFIINNEREEERHIINENENTIPTFRNKKVLTHNKSSLDKQSLLDASIFDKTPIKKAGIINGTMAMRRSLPSHNKNSSVSIKPRGDIEEMFDFNIETSSRPSFSKANQTIKNSNSSNERKDKPKGDPEDFDLNIDTEVDFNDKIYHAKHDHSNFILPFHNIPNMPRGDLEEFFLNMETNENKQSSKNKEKSILDNSNSNNTMLLNSSNQNQMKSRILNKTIDKSVKKISMINLQPNIHGQKPNNTIVNINQDQIKLKTNSLSTSTSLSYAPSAVPNNNQKVIPTTSLEQDAYHRKVNSKIAFSNIIFNNIDHMKINPQSKRTSRKLTKNQSTNSFENDKESSCTEEEESSFSSNENVVAKLPIFEAKKSSSNNKSLTFYINTIFLLKPLVKATILDYLDSKSIFKLGSTTKLLYKESSQKRKNLIMNLVLGNESMTLRKKIWNKISEYTRLNPRTYTTLYSELKNKNSSYDSIIKKDLDRTIPEDPSFKKGNVNNIKLYNILRAYSLYNPKIGYAQGLNFIVAHIIYVYKSEEEVFYFLDCFINKFELYKIIGIENSLLKRKLQDLSILMDSYIPDLVGFFEQNNLNQEYFTTQWLITLFSSVVKSKLLFKIWDYFILYGWSFMNYLMIAILFQYKTIIIKLDPNSLSSFLKILLKSDKFDQSFRQIISITFHYMNNGKL